MKCPNWGGKLSGRGNVRGDMPEWEMSTLRRLYLLRYIAVVTGLATLTAIYDSNIKTIAAIDYTSYSRDDRLQSRRVCHESVAESLTAAAKPLRYLNADRYRSCTRMMQ